MLNMTTLYSPIPVWMTLMLTRGHRVTGKQELVQSFCFKVARRNSIIVMADYVREMTVKKSGTYGEYGSCEHLFSWLY